MGITREIPAGQPFELAGRIVGLERETEMRPGQALAIPRGTWHQIIVDEPGQLVNVAPGPGGQHRPLREA